MVKEVAHKKQNKIWSVEISSEQFSDDRHKYKEVADILPESYEISQSLKKYDFAVK